MELWDAYDEHGNKISGVTLVRGEKIPDGQFHLVCDIIVRHEDGEYLLTRRDPRKPFGGLWEASAGGSAIQGEDALACAKRELFDETGIRADALIRLGTVVRPENHCIYAVFMCRTDWPKDRIVLQEGETVAFRWVTKDVLANMSRDELITYRAQNYIDELKQAAKNREAK